MAIRKNYQFCCDTNKKQGQSKTKIHLRPAFYGKLFRKHFLKPAARQLFTGTWPAVQQLYVPGYQRLTTTAWLPAFVTLEIYAFLP